MLESSGFPIRPWACLTGGSLVSVFISLKLIIRNRLYFPFDLLFIFADDGKDDDEDNTDGYCHKEYKKSRHEN